mmetsp:Transcript_5205/g.12934  ORF Transcript_5205/g.12934 Transcript_5205/m.12934 type:complete len:388 (+) Transcript_5205:1391-2554(+)
MERHRHSPGHTSHPQRAPELGRFLRSKAPDCADAHQARDSPDGRGGRRQGPRCHCQSGGRHNELGCMVHLAWLPEEIQHALRHQKASSDVHCGDPNGRVCEALCERTAAGAHEHEAARGGEATDRIRHGHERCVQCVSHSPDHLVARRTRQAEGVEHGHESSVPAHARCQDKRGTRSDAKRLRQCLLCRVWRRRSLFRLRRRFFLHRRRVWWRWRDDSFAILAADYRPHDDVAFVALLERCGQVGEESLRARFPSHMRDHVQHIRRIHGRRLRPHAAGEVGVADDRHTVIRHILFPRPRQGAIASTRRGEVHDDASRFHGFHHVVLDEDWGFLAGDCRRRYDDVHFIRVFMEHFFLRLLESLARLLGVPARSGAILLEVYFDPLAAH